jgi:hypothetical protein
MTPGQRRNDHCQRFMVPRPVRIATSDKPSEVLEPAITVIPALDFLNRYVRRF